MGSGAGSSSGSALEGLGSGVHRAEPQLTASNKSSSSSSSGTIEALRASCSPHMHGQA